METKTDSSPAHSSETQDDTGEKKSSFIKRLLQKLQGVATPVRWARREITLFASLALEFPSEMKMKRAC